MMGMKSYGFILICIDCIDSSSAWVWGLQDTFFALFVLISTVGFLLFMIPMEPWFVSACSMDFRTRVDELIRDGSGEFDNFHPFSVAQSTGGLAKGFDHQNWVSLPQNVAFDEVPLHSWQWCCGSSQPNTGEMSCVGVQMDSLFHELFDVLEVAHHSFLEILLSVSNVNLVRHLASDLVDDNQNSANAPILTVSGASGVSAVVVADFKFHRHNSTS
jgi:hypothetical protein